MTVLDKVFLGCAVFGGGLFLVRLVLFFVGAGADADVDVDMDVDVDFDVDADVDFDADAVEADVGDTDVSFRLLSFFSVTAFFMMFGLVGLTLRREAEMVEAWSIIGALVAGVFSLWIIAWLIGKLKGLQSSGTLDIRNAVGQDGSVYLTIPAGGTGKVQAVVQGTLRHFNAQAADGQEIRTGERVVVTQVGPGNTLIVTRA